MTTALQIVSRAAEIIGYKDPDETLSGGDSTNFLGILNSLVDGWNTQRLFIVAVAEVATTISTSPVTIGDGQTVDVARPVRIEDGSFIRISGSDYPITWVTREQYDSIVDKGVTGDFACVGYYDAALPTANVYLWPVPTSPVSLHLQLQSQLSEFADLSTEYTLAPGYKKALEYSLAEELTPGRRPLDPQVMRLAASARRAIKNTNFESPQIDQAPYMTPYTRFVAGV